MDVLRAICFEIDEFRRFILPAVRLVQKNNPKGEAELAALALSPYCDPFLRKGSLDRLGIPVMYQGGTRDIGITPSLKKSGGCYPKTAAPAYLVEFEGAGHFAWTDLTGNHHELINNYSIAFFDKYLRAIPDANPEKRLPGVSDLKTK